MGNKAIFDALQRMWQYTITAINRKANADHDHDDVYSRDAVGYRPQTLTAEQQEQARTNIGALSEGDVGSVLTQAKESGEFDGKSAYEYAQAGGYTGTEEEFYDSLANVGSGSPPLRIYAKKNDDSYKQEIIEGGATQTYTAAEIHELLSKRDVVIDTYTDINSQKGHGFSYIYVDSMSDNGSVFRVNFMGLYWDDKYNLVPSYISVDFAGRVYVTSAGVWSGSSVETDTTLTKSSYPANAKKVGDEIAKLSDRIANMGSGSGGGTPIDVTAEVGQTIVVKEVDAGGKPIAWEAVDHQARTHWSEWRELLPETSIDIDPENGGGTAFVDFVLEPNKPYTIKYNGVEYADCVGIDVNDMGVCFGNLGAFEKSFPVTDHPFVLISAATDIDGDGNIDYVIGVFPLDGAESVTLSISGVIDTKIPTNYIPSLESMRSRTINVLPETTVELQGGTAPLPNLDLADGDICTITFNGVTSTSECIKADNGLWCASVDGLFSVYSVFADNTVHWFVWSLHENLTTLTLSIVAKRVERIPPEYFPKEVACTRIFDVKMNGSNGDVVTFDTPIPLIKQAIDDGNHVILRWYNNTFKTTKHFALQKAAYGYYTFNSVEYSDSSLENHEITIRADDTAEYHKMIITFAN